MERCYSQQPFCEGDNTLSCEPRDHVATTVEHPTVLDTVEHPTVQHTVEHHTVACHGSSTLLIVRTSIVENKVLKFEI